SLVSREHASTLSDGPAEVSPVVGSVVTSGAVATSGVVEPALSAPPWSPHPVAIRIATNPPHAASTARRCRRWPYPVRPRLGAPWPALTIEGCFIAATAVVGRVHVNHD